MELDEAEDFVVVGADRLGAAVQQRLDPEMLCRQMEAAEKSQLAYERERQEERNAMLRSRDDQIRMSALHGALMLDYACKEADVVLASAREIEAFLRGDAAEQQLDA